MRLFNGQEVSPYFSIDGDVEKGSRVGPFLTSMTAKIIFY